MKRGSFLICFALIIVLAMPISASAAEGTQSGNFTTSSSAEYLEFGNGEYAMYSISGYSGHVYKMDTGFFFIFDADGFYVVCRNQSYYPYMDFVHKDNTNSTFPLKRYSDAITLCGYTFPSYYRYNYGELFGPSSAGYVLNCEQDLLDLCNYQNGNLKLYVDNTSLSEAVSFFHQPRIMITGVLEKNLKTVMKTVDPLTEVVKILPIGLACLVGWIGLRKGLSLLRQVLFPA